MHPRSVFPQSSENLNPNLSPLTAALCWGNSACNVIVISVSHFWLGGQSESLQICNEITKHWSTTWISSFLCQFLARNEKRQAWPSEQLDLVVVWFQRWPLVDQRDREVFTQVVGITWNQACPVTRHRKCTPVNQTQVTWVDLLEEIGGFVRAHHSQLLLKLQDNSLQLLFLLQVTTLKFLQTSLQFLVL